MRSMQPIDNVDHAIASALEERLDLSHITVTAWRRGDVHALQATVVRALGVSKGEITLDDVIATANVGTVVELAIAQTIDQRHLIDADDERQIEDEYLALVARAGETSNARFLKTVRRQVRAAISLSLAARLDGVTLEQRYQRTPLASALSFVVEVADYFRDYKQQCGMIDTADLLVGELEPIGACALCLVARVGMPPLAWSALQRMVSNAYICNVSV